MSDLHFTPIGHYRVINCSTLVDIRPECLRINRLHVLEKEQNFVIQVFSRHICLNLLLDFPPTHFPL